MAFKKFKLDSQTEIVIYKRRASRSLRLSVAPDGQIRVSIPAWAPYSAGLQFARTKRAWLAEQSRPKGQLVTGQPVGKAHHLRFQSQAGSRVSGRVRPTEIVISHPATLAISSPSVQAVAEATSLRALRRQAEALLPQRLSTLAAKHGFRYNRVSVRQLKSRWGSCDAHGDIVLNVYLMQLPWPSIDYVLLHELAHTKVLRHGPDFWRVMDELLPDVKTQRQTLRQFQPVLDRPLSGGVA